MELTAKTLQEVTFGAKVRGYDPAEVDDFIAAVADGVEQLQDRLRRATERANRAEQQLAAVQSQQVEQTPKPASQQTPGGQEIGRVWEHAMEAANEAIERGRETAQRMVDDATTASEKILRESNAEAETTLTSARSEAESLVTNARSEAERISVEAQAQLRRDIEQLEMWRAHLRTDVDGLVDYLDAEKARLRTHIENALKALDEYGAGAAPPPEADSKDLNSFVATDEAPSADVARSKPDTFSFEAPQLGSTADVLSPETNDESYHKGHYADTSGEPQAQDSEGRYQWSAQSWEHSDEGETQSGEWKSADQSWTVPQEDALAPNWAQAAWSTPPAEAGAAEEGDDDPFLAELRRAVQDDGPLGPRDDDDDSINNLYASEDDEDGNQGGFFRRKK